MGKTYIDTVKYVVYADVTIDGIVEKPDVVGAIFGQTEGLLGDELDLRELQKSGRIGRIEANIETKHGKSVGEIILPSSLDRVETAILAAALETVDRVGPCEAHIKVKKIEDTRTMKRNQVVDRAKQLLKGVMADMLPERKEISELVRDKVKLADVQQYGPEKLAAGPNIDEADHIIVVEGRADVLTMLKADIRNVICLQGKVIPKTVQELSKKKTVTVFVDGDRGGDLIIKQLADCAEVDYVAKAPDGKEVEELTKKEILKALRNKLPFEQFMSKTFKGYTPKEHSSTNNHSNNHNNHEYRGNGRNSHSRYNSQSTRTSRNSGRSYERKSYEKPQAELNPFLNELKELEGTLEGILLDKDKKVLIKTGVKDLIKEMEKAKKAETLVFDGIITQKIVDTAEKAGIKTIVGIKQSKIDSKGLKIYTR